MEDFAAELNEKYDLGIDVARVAFCQDTHDEKSENYKMCKVYDIIDVLRDNGFKDAAVFLEAKLD